MVFDLRIEIPAGIRDFDVATDVERAAFLAASNPHVIVGRLEELLDPLEIAQACRALLQVTRTQGGIFCSYSNGLRHRDGPPAKASALRLPVDAEKATS